MSIWRSMSWSLAMLALVVLATGFTPKPAAADDTLRILAGIAVGALVYSALDDDRDSRHQGSYRPPSSGHCGSPSGNTTRRYDPPSPWQSWSWDTPKQVYDEGYKDGFRDGRDTGRREGYTRGYDRGYDRGYSNGRSDQRHADRRGDWNRGGCW